MHGIIFRELKKYVDARLGQGAWSELVEAAGCAGKVYLPVNEYPDTEMFALLLPASKKASMRVGELLEDFGEFLVPDLIHIYKSSIDPSWRTLDLLVNTEAVIHHAVRLRDRNAKPPNLDVTRTGERVEITYRSERRLCDLAKGIVRGVARHYGERVTIGEPSCMHHGAPACVIHVAPSH